MTPNQVGYGGTNSIPPTLHPPPLTSITGTGGSSVVTNTTPTGTTGHSHANSNNATGGTASINSSGNNGVVERGLPPPPGSSNSLDRLMPCAPQSNPSGSNPGQYSGGGGGPAISHSSMLSSLPLQNPIPIHVTSNNVISTNITNASGQGPGSGGHGLAVPNQDSNTSVGKSSIP